MEILDMSVFLENGIIAESAFYKKIQDFDWDSFVDKRVLVRGCGTTVIPPWAIMVIAARLTEKARVVKYGSEHDSFPIFRRQSRESADVNKA